MPKDTYFLDKVTHGLKLELNELPSHLPDLHILHHPKRMKSFLQKL